LLAGSDKCTAGTATICGKTVKIIDTPGFFDGFTSTKDNFKELSRTLTFAKDGIHAVVFVMNNRYTETCEKSIHQLLLFKGVQPFLFVLLTHANNTGVTKAATDEYIQQTLSSPRCPQGLKDLMQKVGNRVIMVESVNSTAEDYHKTKSKELITMIEDMHKTNRYKIYTNSMLQHAAEVYEKAKSQQKIEIRATEKLSESNAEKIMQLIKQFDGTTSTKNKAANDEIISLEKENEALKKKLEKIEGKPYLEKLTDKILQDEMINSGISAKDLVCFIQLFIQYCNKQSTDKHMVEVVGVGATVAIAGASIGATIGFFIPGPGTVAKVSIGGQLGGLLGYSVGHMYEPVSKVNDDCKQQ